MTMKVYVMTKCKPFKEEVYIGVTNSLKKAESLLRKNYPHMTPTGKAGGVNTYMDRDAQMLFFVHEEQVSG